MSTPLFSNYILLNSKVILKLYYEMVKIIAPDNNIPEYYNSILIPLKKKRLFSHSLSFLSYVMWKLKRTLAPTLTGSPSSPSCTRFLAV